MSDKKRIQMNDLPESAATELTEDDVMKITGGLLLPATNTLNFNKVTYGGPDTRQLLPAVQAFKVNF